MSKLFAYALLLLWLTPLRPLWLDELLQLSDTYRHSLAETVVRVAHNPGGVPLAYLAENVLVNTLGHPFYTAHLFSIVCAIGGMAALLWLVKLLGVTNWAALVYALLPISLRYAVEARQYGPALAFSIGATTLVVWLDQRPSWLRAALYAVVLALGCYLQPYVAFVAAAHFIWAGRRESAIYVAAGCAVGGALFLPWYLYASGFWAQAVREGGYQNSIAWKTPLMILRELSGGGYLLTIALLALAVYGYLRKPNSLLLLCVMVPLPLVFLANTLFHYFFAIRQLLFIVPPLCILAAEGMVALRQSWRVCLTIALAATACIYDVHWFTQSKENWALPAAAAHDKVSAGTCVLAVPAGAAELYRLYQPTLSFCPAEGGRMAAALVSPYATVEQRKELSKCSATGPPREIGGSEFFLCYF